MMKMTCVLVALAALISGCIVPVAGGPGGGGPGGNRGGPGPQGRPAGGGSVQIILPGVIIIP